MGSTEEKRYDFADGPVEDIEKELQAEVDEIAKFASNKNYNLSLGVFSLLWANVHELKTAFDMDNMGMKTALATMASLSIALQVRKLLQITSRKMNKNFPFQLIVGVLIILDHRVKVETKDDLKTVSKYTTINHILMFCIVVINVVASGLGFS